MDEHPPGVSPMYIPLILARKYPEIAKFGCVYMDNWPFAPPMMAVFNPDLMAQFTQDAARPKHEMMYREFRPFTGLNDLVTQEGQIWKMWRSIFNPGFSSKNVLSFVPAIIEEIRDFKVWLHAVAKSGRTAEFEQPTMKLTIDIIGRVALYAFQVEIAKALADQITGTLDCGSRLRTARFSLLSDLLLDGYLPTAVLPTS
jgi:cytochrome P450